MIRHSEAQKFRSTGKCLQIPISKFYAFETLCQRCPTSKALLALGAPAASIRSEETTGRTERNLGRGRGGVKTLAQNIQEILVAKANIHMYVCNYVYT